jgi:hypothetical protein
MEFLFPFIEPNELPHVVPAAIDKEKCELAGTVLGVQESGEKFRKWQRYSSDKIYHYDNILAPPLLSFFASCLVVDPGTDFVVYWIHGVIS